MVMELSMSQRIAMDAEAICRFELYRRMEEGLRTPLPPAFAADLAEGIASNILDHFDLLDEKEVKADLIVREVCRNVIFKLTQT